MKGRVLITGGCGFIGSHLVAHHLAKDDDVYVVDNLSTGTLENISKFKDNKAFQFDEADILSWARLTDAVKWADRIYHFAASVGIFNVIKDPINVITSNISGCKRLFESIAECSSNKPLVILASSSSVYGNSANELQSESDDLAIKPPLHPLTPYAISKIADESISHAYYQAKQIPIIIARLFNTIGPQQTGRYGMVVPRFVDQACSDKAFTVFGNGNQTRSFCDVRDTVTILDLLASNKSAIGETINVGNDVDISINELAALINKCTNKNNPIKYIPYSEAYTARFTDTNQRRPNISKLKKLIAFKYKWTLEQTIHDLIKHYVKMVTNGS